MGVGGGGLGKGGRGVVEYDDNSITQKRRMERDESAKLYGREPLCFGCCQTFGNR